MKNCRITVLKIARHDDLIEKYELPLENPCMMSEGQVFLTNGLEKPENFCDSAWQTLFPFVMTLACGGEGIYGDWMKSPRSAMVSCNDGFRPVSFLVEVVE
ncbi:MAG: TIGR04076 family protein [Oscillospiraceae bacterium]|nr:TIGR04076 family protein [Oscillospiraceae bacterium]